MHFHFSKNKKQSQCSPKASNSGKNHQKSFHPSKSLQIFPNPPNLTTPRTPPEHPQTSPHPPQTHQNTSQILRNHPIRQISGQNLTPLSANSNTTFWKSGTSREPVGNQSGTSREPVGNQSGTSREPVGNQSGKSVHRLKRHKNAGFCRVLALFWSIFGPFCRVFHKNGPKNVKNMHF